MSLSEDLKKLKAQRKESIKDLHLTFIHTKRDLTRTISPDRHIKRHLGVAIGLAAVAGMILAPAPGRARKEKPRKPKKKKSRGGSFMSRMLRPLLLKLVPEARQFIPDLDKAAATADYYAEHPGMVGPPPPSEMRHPHFDEYDEEEHEHQEHRQRAAAKPPVQPLLLQILTVLLKRGDLQKIVMQLVQQFARGGKKRQHNGTPHSPSHDPDEDPTVADANTPPVTPPVA